jgi:hypothetical protein
MQVCAHCPYQGTNAALSRRPLAPSLSFHSWPPSITLAFYIPHCMPTTHTHMTSLLPSSILCPHGPLQGWYWLSMSCLLLVHLVPSCFLHEPEFSTSRLLCFLPASCQCLAYSLTLKMEATCSFKTSVYFQQTAQCYIPEDRTLHNHCCENLRLFRTTHSHFSSCTGVFLGGILDWCVNDFVYTVMWSQIQLSSTVVMDHCDSNGTRMEEDNWQCS